MHFGKTFALLVGPTPGDFSEGIVVVDALEVNDL